LSKRHASGFQPGAPGAASTRFTAFDTAKSTCSGSAEIAASNYWFLDPDVKINLTRLKQGELLLSHSIYRQPVKIIFPKPAFRQQG
jgi:hypothetical protein